VGYSNKDYDNLRASGKILRETFAMLESHIKSGITTLELDKIAHDFIVAAGGVPCFLGYQGYKHSICAAVNEESIHGIPKQAKLRDGDIVSIDIGVRYPARGGMCTDAARTFAVGEITEDAKELIRVTQGCFTVATRDLKAGMAIKEIGKRIEKFVDGRYGIIDTFFGHGIGKNVHEGTIIPNFDVDKPGVNLRVKQIAGTILKEGDIICIEPMINMGTKDVKTAKDGWTVVTADGKLAAHHENTLIIHKNGVEIVT